MHARSAAHIEHARRRRRQHPLQQLHRARELQPPVRTASEPDILVVLVLVEAAQQVHQRLVTANGAFHAPRKISVTAGDAGGRQWAAMACGLSRSFGRNVVAAGRRTTAATPAPRATWAAIRKACAIPAAAAGPTKMPPLAAVAMLA